MEKDEKRYAPTTEYQLIDVDQALAVLMQGTDKRVATVRKTVAQTLSEHSGLVAPNEFRFINDTLNTQGELQEFLGWQGSINYRQLQKIVIATSFEFDASGALNRLRENYGHIPAAEASRVKLPDRFVLNVLAEIVGRGESFYQFAATLREIQISPREFSLGAMFARGQSVEQVATKFNIAQSTVKTRRDELKTKLLPFMGNEGLVTSVRIARLYVASGLFSTKILNNLTDRKILDKIRRLNQLELDILQLINQEFTTEEIAARLNYAPGHIRNTRTTVLKKTDCSKSTELNFLFLNTFRSELSNDQPIKEIEIPASLTDQQQQIIEYILEGLNIAQISSNLKTTKGTLRNYLTDIYRFHGVNSFIELAIKLWRQQHPTKIDSKNINMPQPSNLELSVLHGIKKGLTNQEIADQYAYAEGSIRTAVKKIARKYRCHSRLELAIYTQSIKLPPHPSPVQASSHTHAAAAD